MEDQPFQHASSHPGISAAGAIDSGVSETSSGIHPRLSEDNDDDNDPIEISRTIPVARPHQSSDGDSCLSHTESAATSSEHMSHGAAPQRSHVERSLEASITNESSSLGGDRGGISTSSSGPSSTAASGETSRVGLLTSPTVMAGPATGMAQDMVIDHVFDGSSPGLSLEEASGSGGLEQSQDTAAERGSAFQLGSGEGEESALGSLSQSSSWQEGTRGPERPEEMGGVGRQAASVSGLDGLQRDGRAPSPSTVSRSEALSQLTGQKSKKIGTGKAGTIAPSEGATSAVSELEAMQQTQEEDGVELPSFSNDAPDWRRERPDPSSIDQMQEDGMEGDDLLLSAALQEAIDLGSSPTRGAGEDTERGDGLDTDGSPIAELDTRMRQLLNQLSKEGPTLTDAVNEILRVCQSRDVQRAILRVGGLRVLTSALEYCTKAQIQLVLQVLSAITESSEADSFPKDLVTGRVVGRVLSLLGSTESSLSSSAVATLGSLCVSEICRDVFIRDGGLVAMMRLLNGEEAGHAARAIGNVAAGSDAHRDAVLECRGVAGLVGLLQSDDSREVELAANGLANVAAGSDAHRDAVVASGSVPGLVSLLAAEGGQTIANAARALSNVAAGSDKRRNSILQCGGVKALVRLLRPPSGQGAANAAMALANVVAGSDDAYRDAVVTHGGVSGLIGLLDAEAGQGAEFAAWALGNIAGGSEAHLDVLLASDAAAVRGLVRLLPYKTDERAAIAAWALGSIAAGSNECRDAVVECDGYPGLVGLLDVEVGKGAEHAAWALANIACGSEAHLNVLLASDAAAVRGLVGLLGSPSSHRAQNAACALRYLVLGQCHHREAVVSCGGVEGLVGLVCSGVGVNADVRGLAGYQLVELVKSRTAETSIVQSLVQRLVSSRGSAVIPICQVLIRVIETEPRCRQLAVEQGIFRAITHLRGSMSPQIQAVVAELLDLLQHEDT